MLASVAGETGLSLALLETPKTGCVASRLLIKKVTYPLYNLCNSYTIGCPPVSVDNARALVSGLSCVYTGPNGVITIILYHLHQCIPCTS